MPNGSYSRAGFPLDMVELACDKYGGCEMRPRARTETSLGEEIEVTKRRAMFEPSIAPLALERDGSDAEGLEIPLA